MEWIPRWLGKAYSKLYLSFKEENFKLHDAQSLLGCPISRLRVILSKLNRAGLLSVFKIEKGRRHYRLLDLTTWAIIKASGVKNFGKLKQGRYKNLLAKFLRALLDRYRKDLVSVVLYGSAARGAASLNSDLDFLVICRSFSGSIGGRVGELIKLRDLSYLRKEERWLREKGVLTRPSCYPLTPEEAKYLRLLYLDMTEEAILLLDRANFFERILTKLKAKLTKLGSERVWLDKKRWYWKLKPYLHKGEVITL